MSGGYRSHDCEISNHAGTAFAKGCPGVTPAMTWPDPALPRTPSRPDATYTTPERVCTCSCHNRELPESKG